MLAEKMKIKVIVPTKSGVIVCDFTKTEDLQRFQQDMLLAYKQIEHQIRYMNSARESKMARGLYGGGCLPPPYVLLREHEKDEQIPVIYEPWKDIALALFETFRDCGYDIRRMARYIESQPALFPFMEEGDDLQYQVVTNMFKNEKGYTFTTIRAMKHYFSNLLLAGYVYGGKDGEGNTTYVEGVVEPTIPLDLFEPAYAAIKGEFLDGTVYDPKIAARKYRRDEAGIDALLHGIVTSPDGGVCAFARLSATAGPIYTCFKGGYRGRKFQSGLGETERAWTLPCREIDRIILDRLIALAEYDPNMVKRIQAYFRSSSEAGKSTLEVLDIAIKRKEALLKKLSRTIVLLTQQEEDDMQEEEPKLNPNDPIVKKYREISASLRQLRQQRKEAGNRAQEDPEKTIHGFYSTLGHLRTEFLKRSPQDKKDIIQKLVDEVEIQMLSPHLFVMRLIWIKPITGRDDSEPRDDVVLLWKCLSRQYTGYEWAPEEDARLRILYGQASQQELMEAFPAKSFGRIRNRASFLKLPRRPRSERQFHETITWQDLATALPDEREVLWDEINRLAECTRKNQIGALWFLPIDEVSFLRRNLTEVESEQPSRRLKSSSRTMESWCFIPSMA